MLDSRSQNLSECASREASKALWDISSRGALQTRKILLARRTKKPPHKEPQMSLIFVEKGSFKIGHKTEAHLKKMTQV
jgi:hypothetical protein